MADRLNIQLGRLRVRNQNAANAKHLNTRDQAIGKNNSLIPLLHCQCMCGSALRRRGRRKESDGRTRKKEAKRCCCEHDDGLDSETHRLKILLRKGFKGNFTAH